MEAVRRNLLGQEKHAQWDNVSRETLIVPIVTTTFIKLTKSTPGVTVAFIATSTLVFL
jgi:hypothetical protein